MSNDSLKELIEQILVEKRQQIITRIDSLQKTLVDQLEELKKLNDFSEFQIPDGLQTGQDSRADKKIDILHEFVKKISAADNQNALIDSLLAGINNFCSRAALFLVRDDKLVGWSGQGFSQRPDAIKDKEIKKIFFSISADTIFKQVLTTKQPYSGAPFSQADDHLIYSRFGGGNPDEIVVLPFFVKGKPQAVIYADTFGEQPIEQREIEILSIVGEMSLDLLPIRQKMMARVQTKEYIDEPPEEPEETVRSAEVTEEAPHIHEETAHSIRENDPERKARVIINDIILYNKAVVDKGIENRNLYSILEDTIMQAKEEYLRKFSDLSAFERNLIAILAKGDRDLLKGYNFETI